MGVLVARMLLTFGQISLVAVISFVIGKIWASNAELFAVRQKAYSRFLENCPHPTEIFMEKPRKQKALMTDHEFLNKIKQASAEFSLFASPMAAYYSGRYFTLVGELLAVSDKDSQSFSDKCELAQGHFHELILQMRKDSLGLTWFGIQEFFASKNRSPMKGLEEK